MGHRGVLWLRPLGGGALSPEVSNSDPFYERVGGMGQAQRAGVSEDPRGEAHRRLARGGPHRSRDQPVPLPLSGRPRRSWGQRPPCARRKEGRERSAPPETRERSTGRPPLVRDETRSPRRGRDRDPRSKQGHCPAVLGLADRLRRTDGRRTARPPGYAERARGHPPGPPLAPRSSTSTSKDPDEPGHDGDAPRKRRRSSRRSTGRSSHLFLDGLDPAPGSASR